MCKPGRSRSASAPLPAGVVLAAALVVLVTRPAAAVYDFGPIKPYGSTPYEHGQSGEGFPTWYRDDSGTMCEPCLGTIGTEAGCLSTQGELNELVDEFFYYHHSTEVTITDAASGGINVMYEAAVEGAYLNEQPIPGDEMVFQRTRVRIDCPTVVPADGKPYLFRVEMPYTGEVYDIVGDRKAPKRLIGDSCAFFTSDVGTAAGDFGANTAGPITSFLVAPEGAGATDGFPGTLSTAAGTGPTRLGVKNGDLPKKLRIYFPAEKAADYSNPFAVLTANAQASAGATLSGGVLDTDSFATSCREYRGSTARLVDAVLSVKVNPTDASEASLDVWAEALSGRTLSVEVRGDATGVSAKTINLLESQSADKDAMNPFVPGTWRGQRPATYYGRVDLTRSGGESAAWSVLVKLIEGGVVEERVVKPKLVLEGAGISLVNGKLAFNIKSLDGREFWCGHFNTKGEFKNIRKSGVVATSTGRKLLGPQPHGIVDSIDTSAAPKLIHCCPSTGSKADECEAYRVSTTGSSASSSGSGATNTEPLAEAVLVSSEIMATAGVEVKLSAAGSKPTTCAALWAFKEPSSSGTGPSESCGSTIVSALNGQAATWKEFTATFTAPTPTTTGDCAVVAEFTLTCSATNVQKATANIVISPPARVGYTLNGVDAAGATTPYVLRSATSTALVDASTAAAATTPVFAGLDVHLVLQAFKSTGAALAPASFVVDNADITRSNCVFVSNKNVDFGTQPTVIVTCKADNPANLASALSPITITAVPKLEGNKWPSAAAPIHWNAVIPVRRDTIGLPNLGLSTFKIKNGNNGNIGGEWRLKWTGMTSAAAVARPGESVTVSCFYTAATRCRAWYPREGTGGLSGNVDCHVTPPATFYHLFTAVCSATGCPDLAETRANNPFSAPAGTTLHHFYCRSTAGGHMAWQWTPAT